MEESLYALVFYVPETHLEEVKIALFEKGAGQYKNYDCCAWQVRGEGQFRPLKGSKPFIGQEGTIEKIPEYRVEMICKKSVFKEVIKALKNVHPYEEPAYVFMETISEN